VEGPEQDQIGDRVARIDRVDGVDQRAGGGLAARDGGQDLALGARQAAGGIGGLLELALEGAGGERQGPGPPGGGREGARGGSGGVTAIQAVIASSIASRDSGVRRGQSSASCSGLSWPRPRKLGTSGWRSIETRVSWAGRPRRARRASRRIRASWSNRSCSN